MSNLVSLPHTSLSVSRLCLGTNMFGTALDAQKSHALLDRFTSLGGNFIDTARMYGDWIPDAPIGASERTIGGGSRVASASPLSLRPRAVDLICERVTGSRA